MRVLCLNCNRGSSRISGEILEKNADIILLQEWISHKTDQSAIAQDLLNSLGEISSTRYLVTASKQKHITLHKSDRILITQHDSSILINTYFPAGKTTERNEHFQKLSSIIDNLNLTPMLIAGDFNLAPRKKDGWYGNTYSDFTKKSERENFLKFLRKYELYDLGMELDWAPTLERDINGKCSRFRCDLFLLKEDLLELSKMSYDHKFRTQKGLSDHSALLVELEL